MRRSRKILIGLPGLLVVLIVAAGFFLSAGRQTGERHTPYAFPERFDFDSGSFADYRAYSERRIRAANVDGLNDNQIANLLPFELVPESDCPQSDDGQWANGIVLTHGLFESPYSMRALGEYFHDRCFHVLGQLMPDHGTRPGDFIHSRWQDWSASVHLAARDLAGKVDTLYLGGHSAGGALSVLEAIRNPDVDALILFAPALMIEEAARYAKVVRLLGNIFPKAAWLTVKEDGAIYRYESITFNAAAEMWGLIQAIGDQAPDVPILTVASVEDTTVDTQAALDFMRASPNPLNHTLLYSQHALPAYPGTSIVRSPVPEQGILSLSHLGLMIPPMHPHYGAGGAYRSCYHYPAGSDAHARCAAGDRDFYGETTAENLASGVIERISFNPYYDDLLAEIGLFLQQVNMDRRGLPLTPQVSAPEDLDDAGGQPNCDPNAGTC